MLVSERREARLRLGEECRHDLDRVHLTRQLCQDSRLIARAGAHFEHATRRRQIEQRGHHGHNVRLRDRLPMPDRERLISVRLLNGLGWHKQVPGHSCHSLQNDLVVDTSPPQFCNERCLGRLMLQATYPRVVCVAPILAWFGQPDTPRAMRGQAWPGPTWRPPVFLLRLCAQTYHWK